MRHDIEGNRLLELKEPLDVKLETHVPTKYIIVDTETRDVWVHNGETFQRANKKQLKIAARVIEMERDIVLK